MGGPVAVVRAEMGDGGTFLHPPAEHERHGMGQMLLVKGLQVRPAASRRELERAYALVHANYVARGYMEEHPSGMRVSVFNALPTTVTFVSVLRRELLGTVTLVADSPLGLPMDEVFHDRLQALRARGRKVAEVTMLADRRGEFFRTFPMVKLLMKRVFDCATLVMQADDLCIAINPRHQEYYERYLLFEPFSGPVALPSVRGHPAVGERLDLNTASQRCSGRRELQEQFFMARTPTALLRERYVWQMRDLREVFVRKTSVFRDAPPRAVAYLREVYPDCPWHRWCPQGAAAGDAS